MVFLTDAFDHFGRLSTHRTRCIDLGKPKEYCATSCNHEVVTQCADSMIVVDGTDETRQLGYSWHASFSCGREGSRHLVQLLQEGHHYKDRVQRSSCTLRYVLMVEEEERQEQQRSD